jgi:uncharacterized protein (TIGR02145 family)
MTLRTMKKTIKTCMLILAFIATTALISCKKDDKNNDPGTVKDVDGNVYHSVTIGTQVWMIENLKTTKYSDGSAIPPVTSNATWFDLNSPGFCWYNDDEVTYKKVYGALYNWYAVNTNKLCPSGWHVPSAAEWTTLVTYLGGQLVAGGKLKESKTIHWQDPNLGATNESGFTALPGGCASANGYWGIGTYGYWWSSTEGLSGPYGIPSEIYIPMHYNSVSVSNGYDSSKNTGYSVRCIKN